MERLRAESQLEDLSSPQGGFSDHDEFKHQINRFNLDGESESVFIKMPQKIRNTAKPGALQY